MKNSICLYNFNVKNVNPASLDLYIDGEIVSAETEDIYKEYWNDTTSISFRTIRNTILQANPSIVNIYINSPGGNVTEAMATHDFIVELQNRGVVVNGYGYGIIASSSTYILSACKNSYISKNSFYMIHDLSGGVYGTLKDIGNYYQSMITFDNLVKDFYVNLTGKSKEQITQWMDAETYFTGTDAVNYGFVKNLTDNIEFTNQLNPENFQFKNKEVFNVFNSRIKPANNFSDTDKTFLNGLISHYQISINMAKEILKTTTDPFVQSLAGEIIGDETDEIEDIQEQLTGITGFDNKKRAFKNNINLENVDMNKFTKSIVDALKSAGFIQNKEGDTPPKQMTEETLTNALSEAFKDFKPEPSEEQISNSVANYFKDGLPENIAKQIGEAVKNELKDLPKSEDIENLKKDLEAVQEDIANNKGGAKPPKNSAGSGSKYEHEGITFDN